MMFEFWCRSSIRVGTNMYESIRYIDYNVVFTVLSGDC